MSSLARHCLWRVPLPLAPPRPLRLRELSRAARLCARSAASSTPWASAGGSAADAAAPAAAAPADAL